MLVKANFRSWHYNNGGVVNSKRETVLFFLPKRDSNNRLDNFVEYYFYCFRVDNCIAINF